jgi:hypothetical protein
MSVRQQVTDAITPQLPDTWNVIPYTDEPNVLTDPLVMVTATNINPARSGIPSRYDVETHVIVLTPTYDDPAADSDAVDDAVLLTLHAVLRMRSVTQAGAERITFQGGHPAWDITVNIEASVTDE